MSHSKRSSSHPNLKVGSGSIVCRQTYISGDITIGARCVVHPEVSILAEAGPIIIGDGNLFEERTSIVNKFPDDANKAGQSRVMIIGNHNLFEVASYSEALQIGDFNSLEVQSYIGPNVRLSNGCIIGPKCRLETNEELPENTLVYGDLCLRRTMSEKPQSQNQLIDSLTKLIPNYHHVWKPRLK